MKIKKFLRQFLCSFFTIVLLGSFILFPLNAKAYENDVFVSPKAEGEITINLLVAEINPTLTSLDGKPFGNGSTTISASEYFHFSGEENLNNWIANFEEVSHNTVKFNVVDRIIIDEFPKYMSIESLDNESFQKLFKRDASGYGDWYSGVTNPDYAKYDTAGDLDYEYYTEKLDLANRRNAGEFDMLYLTGIDPLSPYETCTIGKNPFWVNGIGCYADCPNFLVVTPTFSRFDGSVENIGHLAEFMLGYNYSDVPYAEDYLDGSDYLSLNDWEKYSLCKFIATDNTEIYGYGMVHFSPNSDSDYDWSNPNKVKYYKDWKNGEEISDFSPYECYLNNPQFAYNNDPCISHHRWWFYNMPCEDGRDEDGYYKNWWRYIFTADYVTDVMSDKSYSASKAQIEPGERKPLLFKLRYLDAYIVETDVLESSAAVNVSDESILSLENGEIVGLKEGVANVEIKIDGKSLTYEITVAKNEEPEETISDEDTDTLEPIEEEPSDITPAPADTTTAYLSQSGIGSVAVIGIAGGAVALAIIIAIAILIVFIKMRKE